MRRAVAAALERARVREGGELADRHGAEAQVHGQVRRGRRSPESRASTGTCRCDREIRVNSAAPPSIPGTTPARAGWSPRSRALRATVRAVAAGGRASGAPSSATGCERRCAGVSDRSHALRYGVNTAYGRPDCVTISSRSKITWSLQSWKAMPSARATPRRRGRVRLPRARSRDWRIRHRRPSSRASAGIASRA